MFRSLALIVVCATGVFLASAAHSREPSLPSTDMDGIVQRDGEAFVKAGNTDGLSIAIVRDGQTTYFNFGTISRNKKQLPNQDTVYEIGSISKTFTSLLLAHALVEKKASASDDMRRYLPGAYPNLQFQGTPVTLKDLVATTSALPDNIPDIMAMAKANGLKRAPFVIADALQRYNTEALLADLRKASLSYKPGTMPMHSNVAAQLVGLILEKTYSRSYEDLLSVYVEKPLGMKSGVAKERLPHMATGYMADGTATPLIPAVELAAGGLRYSSSDMARYVTLQLQDSDPAVALTHQPLWGSVDEGAVGFDWNIAKTIDGKIRLNHSGGTFGFSSFMDLYPDLHYGIVLMANRSDSVTQYQLQVLSEQIVADLFGKPPAVLALEHAFTERGYQHADATVRSVLQSHPELHLSEDYINTWGYQLLKQGRPKDAVAILEYNTIHHPGSANAFDSLGEACRAAGDVPQSIANYRRALELNPSNTHAQQQLREMGDVPSGRVTQ